MSVKLTDMERMAQHGGPAFPLNLPSTHYYGMSLRDYFAGQALAGMTADTHNSSTVVAAAAYQYADAMLKARGPE